MPGADRFTTAGGDPPVISAYVTRGGRETLLGYVFLTSDLPPEQFGYSGPIEALVGMRPDGTITGKEGDSFTAGSLGDYTVGADGVVLLGEPFVFNADNIDDFDF